MEMKSLKRCTEIIVEAEVNLGLKGVDEPQKITVKGIPRIWLWDYSDRWSQEMFAVVHWLFDQFDNNLEWYEVVYVASSPVKDGEDPYPMLTIEISSDKVIEAMTTETEVIWGTGE
jgi:hypothetical protein